MSLSSDDMAELRELLEGLIRLQGWQGELLRRMVTLVGAGPASAPSAGQPPTRRPRPARRPRPSKD